MASELIKYEFNRADLFAGMYEVERKFYIFKDISIKTSKLTKTGLLLSSLIKRHLKNLMSLRSETSQLGGSLGEVKGFVHGQY